MSHTNRGLGRLHAPDERDRKFLLARPSAEAAKISSRTWYTTNVFDQGETSQCVAFSSIGWLMASPIRNTKNLPTFQGLYHDCQVIDEWPREDPDVQGTSIRAAMKVLKTKGYVSEYRWAFNTAAVMDFVLAKGPMVVGSLWFEPMFEPDKDGFLHVGGEPVGGHAYLIIGCNKDKLCPDGTRGSFRIVNSWSRQWGQAGRAWISFKDFDRLIQEEGEAATATEVIRPVMPA